MVLLDLSDIIRTPGARASHAFSERLKEEEDLACVGPVEGSLTVTNGGAVLVLRGRLKTRVRLTCTRCLEEFEQEVEADLSEDFALGSSLTAEEKQAVEMEGPGEAILRENVLDLAELLRQMVLVALPLRAICREECLGICPRCGKNRNQGECGCQPEPEASPFEALRGLLGEEKGQAGPERQD